MLFRTKSLLTLGEDVFYVSECKGEGGFAKVFAASKQETEGAFFLYIIVDKVISESDQEKR